ncbi:MAG: hypothetical protein IJC16_07760, partial [Rikenellaceae bacterium]|nr:hypothetical protein [Rikenellaceae bacterium]
MKTTLQLFRRIRKLALFTVLGYMAPVAVQAQVVPPSPEGEALVRSIDVPVDYSTGIPRIALPLHQIKYRDIVLPITLNYQASGIKIKDIATWAGLGWRLSAGGKVTRVVKG